MTLQYLIILFSFFKTVTDSPASVLALRHEALLRANMTRVNSPYKGHTVQSAISRKTIIPGRNVRDVFQNHLEFGQLGSYRPIKPRLKEVNNDKKNDSNYYKNETKQ